MRYSQMVFLAAIFSMTAVHSTSWAFSLGGKEKIAELQAEVDRLRVENQRLKGENEQYKAKLSLAEQELAGLQSRSTECEKKLALEAKRGSGIKIVFFNGDIIYEVASEAFVDYKAGMRYRSLADSAFHEKFKSFEEGRGGDFEVLSIMKLVDASNDRLVDEKEALAFRQTEENNFAKAKSR